MRNTILFVFVGAVLLLSGCCGLSEWPPANTSQLGATVEGYECMESPGCFEHVQRCYDGICTPLSTCGTVHWDNGSACNCTQDIGPWTRQAKGSC